MSFLWQATFIKKNLPVLIPAQYPHKSMVPTLYAYGIHVPEPKKEGNPMSSMQGISHKKYGVISIITDYAVYRVKLYSYIKALTNVLSSLY